MSVDMFGVTLRLCVRVCGCCVYVCACVCMCVCVCVYDGLGLVTMVEGGLALRTVTSGPFYGWFRVVSGWFTVVLGSF